MKKDPSKNSIWDLKNAVPWEKECGCKMTKKKIPAGYAVTVIPCGKPHAEDK